MNTFLLATLLIFNDQWIGSYDLAEDKFSVTIGECGDCTYNIPDINFADPLGTATIHGMIITPGHEGRLDYFAYNRTWFTLNYDDSQLQRLGTYRLYEVVEPSPWWMILAGLFFLRRKKAWTKTLKVNCNV
jgi:hypothetical protein